MNEQTISIFLSYHAVLPPPPPPPHLCIKYDENPGWVHPEKSGGGWRHPSWIPYPISDQNLWFSLLYFTPDQKFDTLFQTWSPGPRCVTGARDKLLRHVHGWRTDIKREMVLSLNDEEVASSKKIPNSRPECTNHTPFQTKMVEIDTLFQTKKAKKPYPFAPHKLM